MIAVRVEASVPAVAGLVWATTESEWEYPAGFEGLLASVLSLRLAELSAEEDVIRGAARDMLRHGRYKPTGRGKPASEYLIRAAREHTFPRINPVVDICNLVSLECLCPISLWDIDKAGTDRFVVRHGREGESYVFNSAGQEIDVADLVSGCRVFDDPAGEPIVNPVKDSLLTKTDETTRRVAAIVYGPTLLGEAGIQIVVRKFADLLAACGSGVESGCEVITSGGDPR